MGTPVGKEGRRAGGRAGRRAGRRAGGRERGRPEAKSSREEVMNRRKTEENPGVSTMEGPDAGCRWAPPGGSNGGGRDLSIYLSIYLYKLGREVYICIYLSIHLLTYLYRCCPRRRETQGEEGVVVPVFLPSDSYYSSSHLLSL
jgi:hypothetical protein